MTDFQQMLSVMDTDDLDITLDSLNAAQSKLHRAHPGNRDMWFELMDLQDDLHAAWREAFLRRQLQTASSPAGVLATTGRL